MRFLPGEHIYSYLYRGYMVHGIDGYSTIINYDGLFKRRLATIKPELINPFLDTTNFRDLCVRSGFIDVSLKLADDYIEEYVGSEKFPKGLKLHPINKKNAHTVNYCSECVQDFIKEFGFAYLLAVWLNDEYVCKKHDRPVVSLISDSRAQTIKQLKIVLSGDV